METFAIAAAICLAFGVAICVAARARSKRSGERPPTRPKEFVAFAWTGTGPVDLFASWYSGAPEDARAGALTLLAALGDLPERVHARIAVSPTETPLPRGGTLTTLDVPLLIFAGDLPGLADLPGVELPPAPPPGDLLAAEAAADWDADPHMRFEAHWTDDNPLRRGAIASGRLSIQLPNGFAKVMVHPRYGGDLLNVMRDALARPWRQVRSATPADLDRGLPDLPRVNVTVVRLR